jgi:3-oxoacyl-[acyl-carrier-protein] synthase II
MPRAAVVTGMGVVSPYGVGRATFWSGLVEGRPAIGPITLFETEGFRSRLAGEVPRDVRLPRASRRRSRADRLVITAADEAVADAGLTRADLRPAAIVIGGIGGGMLEAESWYLRAARDGVDDAGLRRALSTILPGAHAECLARRYGVAGPTETVVLACSSGAAALAFAADLIGEGVVPVALAGGVDALTRICFMGFNALKLLDPRPCRPFSRDRKGMSVGEGAGIVVLEEASFAVRRGARVYAGLAGYGLTTDAYHITAPRPDAEGSLQAMVTALERAGVSPTDVGYVNAHGTGTPQNDRAEAIALGKVFDPAGVLISASKSLIGHTMAAAGALESIATILSLVEGVVPPTANLVEPDPEIPFDCVPVVARRARLRWAMSNSFGFGGQNVSLLFGPAGAGGTGAGRVSAGPARRLELRPDGPRGPAVVRLREDRGRILITGVGMVSALGAGGGDVVRSALACGRPGLGPVTAFATDGLPSHLAGQVGELGDQVTAEELRRLPRVSQFAVVACRLALIDAGIEAGSLPTLGLVLGSDYGDIRSIEAFFSGFVARGPLGLSALVFPSTVMNAMAGHAAMAVGARGPMATINHPGVSGEIAVARAVSLLRSGRTPAALVGGVDEVCPILYRELARGGRLSPGRGGATEGCWPFDRRANGTVLGEGATVLLLEAEAHAAARGARPYAELGDAVVSTLPAAARRVGRRPGILDAALEAGGPAPGGVDAVYLTGSGDPVLDAVELRLLARLSGDPAQAARWPGARLTALTPLVGSHAGLGGLRVAAAAVATVAAGQVPALPDLRSPVHEGLPWVQGGTAPAPRRTGAVLVHAVAPGGSRVAITVRSLTT